MACSTWGRFLRMCASTVAHTQMLLDVAEASPARQGWSVCYRSSVCHLSFRGCQCGRASSWHGRCQNWPRSARVQNLGHVTAPEAVWVCAGLIIGFTVYLFRVSGCRVKGFVGVENLGCGCFQGLGFRSLGLQCHSWSFRRKFLYLENCAAIQSAEPHMLRLMHYLVQDPSGRCCSGSEETLVVSSCVV